MTEIIMRRQGTRLSPVDEIGADELKLVPADKDVLVTIRASRNLRQLRLAWVLAQKVSEAVDFLPDRRSAMDWLLTKARHVRMLQNPRTKQVVIVPKSIAFDSLSQQEFTRVLDRMIFVCCSDIIPGLDEGKLRAELESVVGISDDASPSGEGHSSRQSKVPAT